MGSKVSYCDTPFWESSILTDPTPSFTACFENSILAWIPLLYLLVIGLIWILNTRRGNKELVKFQSSSLVFIKFTSLVILTVFEIARLVVSASNEDDTFLLANFLRSLQTIFQYVLVMAVVYHCRRLEKRFSIFLLVFWVIQLICYTIILYSKSLNFKDSSKLEQSEAILFMMIYVFVFLNVIITCFSEDSEFKGVPSTDTYPEHYVSLLSKLLFLWMGKVMFKAYRSELKDEDIWKTSEEHASRFVTSQYEKEWNELADQYHKQVATSPHVNGSKLNGDKDEKVVAGKKVKKPSLGGFLFRINRNGILLGGACKFFEIMLNACGPLILDILVKFTEDKSQSVMIGYFFAVVLFVFSIFQNVLTQHFFHNSLYAGFKSRTLLMNLIYKKSFRLSNESKKKVKTGEIINMQQIDAQQFVDFAWFGNALWTSPLELLVAAVILWFYLGNAIFAGIGLLAVLLPLNSFTARMASRAQARKLVINDSRVKTINEILSGIKVIKLYGWEISFQNLILSFRNMELKVLRICTLLDAFINASFGFTSFLMTIVCFITFIYMDENNELNPSVAYVSLTLFARIRVPLFLLGPSVSKLLQLRVSLARIQRYLLLEDADPNAVLQEASLPDAIVFDHADFAWDMNEGVPFFQNLNITIPRGKLVAVVGRVGSGKSSFLSSLLGEMNKLNGKVYVNGSLSYVAQQAWIQNETLRENILFGREFDNLLYSKVIDACALVTDLNILPAGDRTEIGEKGINLSGGQKQRISLARSVYNGSDIYLFDDPLSAVDAHVGKHIFENVIGPNGMLKSKTRLFVTNSLSFLPSVDEIIMLDNGRIAESGTYEQLISNNSHFAKFVENYFTGKNNEEEGEEDVKKEQEHELKAHDEKEEVEGEKIIEKEKLEAGSVKFAVFVSYLKSCSFWFSGLFVIAYALMNVFSALASRWLSSWSNSYVTKKPTQDEEDYYLLVYCMIGVAQNVCLMLADGLFSVLMVNYSARHLHDQMLKCVMRSPMRFFESTPLGRIINRFSKDIQAIEFVITPAFRDVIYCLFELLTIVIMISITTPIFLSVLAPISVVYYFVQRLYVNASSKLRRLDAVTKSPVYSHLGESLTGVTTIKAYGAIDRFIETNEQKIDQNNRFFILIFVLNRLSDVMMSTLGGLIILFSSLFAIVGRDTLSPGLAGLSISYALSVSLMCNHLVKMTAQFESNLVSIERLREYCSIPSEAEWSIEEKKPDKEWPNKGVIKFKNFTLRYREELDPALKSISADISPGEKIGIVGRTGAGKSSLTLGLFRIIEINEGTIEIDGVNIKEIGLHDLRQNLTIIPQDPVIFSGTLRMNLDPFEQYDDKDLWSALEKAHLKDFVQGLDKKLLFECSEGGENLSVGQRQLVCLARALLRHTKILVLDEATAAIDHSTDELIQTTIREAFADCTILTIAHRLNTILDSDRIMVLEKGKVIEFDSPNKLLADSNSVFYSMAKSAGIV